MNKQKTLDQDQKKTEPEEVAASRSWEDARKRSPTETSPWEGEENDL